LRSTWLAQNWLASRFFGIVRIPVAGERVPRQFDLAAAEGVTHPESLRQKDRNGRAYPFSPKYSGERGRCVS
jgi:hypothetical protein